MRKLDRYRENLRVDTYSVYSYDTLVAKISHKNKTVRSLGWHSVTTSKHINYVAREYGYKVVNDD